MTASILTLLGGVLSLVLLVLKTHLDNKPKVGGQDEFDQALEKGDMLTASTNLRRLSDKAQSIRGIRERLIATRTSGQSSPDRQTETTGIKDGTGDMREYPDGKPPV